MARRSDQRQAAVFALYQADVTGRPATELLGRDASAFTAELVEGTSAERAELDPLSSATPPAGRWTASCRSSATSCAWRSTSCRSRPDVPVEVAIDEAIEAAKELCSAEAPGFVNGILGAAHREEVGSR